LCVRESVCVSVCACSCDRACEWVCLSAAYTYVCCWLRCATHPFCEYEPPVAATGVGDVVALALLLVCLCVCVCVCVASFLAAACLFYVSFRFVLGLSMALRGPFNQSIRPWPSLSFGVPLFFLLRRRHHERTLVRGDCTALVAPAGVCVASRRSSSGNPMNRQGACRPSRPHSTSRSAWRRW
jgi:hypothetical protein